MSCVNVTDHPSPYSFRKPFRQDGLFAILDATRFESLAATLRHSDLEYESLFSGEDALLLEAEAPFIVALEREKSDVWKPILRYAQHRNAGILVASKEDLGKVRRHWKKWLSVKIPDQEKPVLFRFYDPRVLLAFVMTLPPADAAAFFGPVTDIAAYQKDNLQILTPQEDVADHNPRPLGALGGGLYSITPAQMQAMENVVSEEFQERIFGYFRTVWPRESIRFTDNQLKEQIHAAIRDAEFLGARREQDIFNIMHVRILRPDILLNDTGVMVRLLENEDNPKIRAGMLAGHLTHDFQSPEERQYYNFQKYRFSLDGFGEGVDLGFQGETFPDLFLRHR
mgnify:CR=1 FL=1